MVVLRAPHASVRAHRVVLATNAFRGLVPAIRARVVPVWDYVLMTEPLTPSQLDGHRVGRAPGPGRRRQPVPLLPAHGRRPHPVGWLRRRLLPGQRHRPGAASSAPRPQQLLARQFFDTFPQLEGLRFTHSVGRAHRHDHPLHLTAGTAHGGRVAYAVGYTGLGVGASRFGARVALDLVSGEPTELTRLRFVRRKPLPFPPEPVRSLGINLTRRAIAAADRHDGRRGLWLRTLDRFGVGFDS